MHVAGNDKLADIAVGGDEQAGGNEQDRQYASDDTDRFG